MRGRRFERSSEGGFSLLEVVIAIGILSFGMLGLALMQLYSLNHSAMGRHTGDAASIGRSYLEQVHRLPWATINAEVGTGWQNPAWTGQPASQVRVAAPTGTFTENDYTVDWRVTAVGGTTCVLNVELRVTWAEESLSNNKSFTLATRRYNNGGATC